MVLDDEKSNMDLLREFQPNNLFTNNTGVSTKGSRTLTPCHIPPGHSNLNRNPNPRDQGVNVQGVTVLIPYKVGDAMISNVCNSILN